MHSQTPKRAARKKKKDERVRRAQYQRKGSFSCAFPLIWSHER